MFSGRIPGTIPDPCLFGRRRKNQEATTCQPLNIHAVKEWFFSRVERDPPQIKRKVWRVKLLFFVCF